MGEDPLANTVKGNVNHRNIFHHCMVTLNLNRSMNSQWSIFHVPKHQTSEVLKKIGEFNEFPFSPPGPNSFSFMQFSRENWPNNKLEPPGNPGSATDFKVTDSMNSRILCYESWRFIIVTRLHFGTVKNCTYFLLHCQKVQSLLTNNPQNSIYQRTFLFG